MLQYSAALCSWFVFIIMSLPQISNSGLIFVIVNVCTLFLETSCWISAGLHRLDNAIMLSIVDFKFY